MSETHRRRALTRAITQALETMAFLEARPIEIPGPAGTAPAWSWVKVVEPSTGTVVLAFDPALASDIASSMLGGGSIDARAIADAQNELTNVVAGRLIHELLGDGARLSLGIPRSGRGAPDVTDPGWVGQAFDVGGRRLVGYVHGDGLAGAADQRTPITAASSPDEVTRALDQLPPDQPTGAHPTRIASFRIVSLLGEGGMGMVYRAHHVTLEREVALKVMRPEFARNEKFSARFLREARIAARIDHAHVVNVYDAGVEDGLLFIAMRFVPGGDLAGRIRERGAIPENEALLLIGQCLMGLQAIADHGMIHRDIKPANILLETDGSPRLADLGLARLVLQDDGLSQPGTTQGTPSFMSPEQARGSADIDIRSDIYAIGATLYTMLVGHPPFAGSSVYETVAQVLYEQPRSPREVNPAVSIEVDALVMRAMAKAPSGRYETPRAFLAAIEELLSRRDRHDSGGAPRDRHPSVSTRVPEGTEGGGWMQRLFRSRPPT